MKLRRFGKWVPAIGLAVLIGAAVACSSGTSPTATQTAPTSTPIPPTATEVPASPTSAPVMTATATGVAQASPTATASPTTPTTSPTAPVQQGNMGGTLNIAAVGSIQSFDPMWTTASATGAVTDTILEPLMALKPDFSQGFVLASSWQQSSDGLTWTWKIRSGVTFHDGTPLTTDQVIGSMRRQNDKATLWKLLVDQFGYSNFDQMVTKVDDTTFQIHLQKPTFLVVAALSSQNFQPLIVEKKWYSIPSDTSASADGGPPIGTGPYKYDSWTPGDRWSAVRFDNYKPSPEPSAGRTGKKVAYFDRVNWIEIPDQTTRVAALQSGEVDWAPEFTQSLLSRVQSDANLKTIPSPPSRLLIHFNQEPTAKPMSPFADPQWGQKLRKAVVMAYDNKAALQLATGGNANAWRLCPSLLQCGTIWETDAGSQGLYDAMNVAQAKQIVESSPYAGYTVRLMDPQDRQPAHGAVLVARQVLQNIGFKVDFEEMDWATMVTRRADPTLWDMFSTWSGVGVRYSPYGHLGFGELQYDAWFNHYQDVAGTERKILGEIATATSTDQLKALNVEFQKYFYEDAIFLQIGEFYNSWASSKKVQGDLSDPFAGTEPYNKWFTS